jgi:N-acetylmuramoyl-L-alanine amidase
MGGTVYRVKQGDTIVRIADKNHFRSWEAIWNHEKNADLRAKRPNPHVLAPDDEVFIPDKDVREFTCSTDRRHTFRLRRMTQFIQVKVCDEAGQPLPGRAYEVRHGGTVLRNATDAEGFLREQIPLDVTSVEATVWLSDDPPEKVTWTLHVGHLDPISTVAGAKKRLANLGYSHGSLEDDELDDATQRGLRDFQRDQGLQVTGRLDETTRVTLEEAHDHAAQAPS